MERFSIDKMSFTCKWKRQKIDIKIEVTQPNYSRWVFCELFKFLFILWFPSENYLLTCRGTRISAIEKIRYSVQFLRLRSSVFRNSALRPVGIQNSALDPVIGLGIDFPFPFRYSVPFIVQRFDIPAHPRFRLSAFRIQDSRFWHYVLLHWSVNRIYVPHNMLYCRLIG